MTDPGDPPPPPDAPATDPPPDPRPDPPTAPAAEGPTRRRGLVRSGDRYVGGVAGGLAEALDVDPIVVRVALVVGTLYVPVLVLVYALAWLALPDERTGTTLLRAIRTPDGWRPVVGIAALAVGVAVLAPDLGPGGNGSLTAGVLLAGIGVLLVLRNPGDADREAAQPPPGTAAWPDPPDPDPGLAENLADDGGRAPHPGAPLERLVRQRLHRHRRRRPPSHLGWLGLSGLVVLVGVLAAVDRGVEPVEPGLAVSLGLLLVGGVLLLAAWRGRARLLILPGVALLPLWVGWGLSEVPRYDHDGDVSYLVTSRDELRRSYEHGYGQMDVDLRSVELRPGERRRLALGLTGGRARLYVPPAAHLVIRGDIGAGQVEVWEDPYFGRVAGSGQVVAGDVDLRVADPEQICTEQPTYGPEGVDEMGYYVPPEITGSQTLTPWGEPCEPEPPVEDPPVLEVTLDVGIGAVEVHRAAA